MRATPRLLASVLLAGLGTGTGGTPAGADDAPSIITAPHRIHIGEPITAVANFCGTGKSVTAAQLFTFFFDTKGPAMMPTPLEPATLDIHQTASGLSFSYTPTQERTGVGFGLTCSDGTVAADSSWPTTMVYPPTGHFWWHAVYDALVGTAGFPYRFSIGTIDCVDESTATATAVGPGLPPIPQAHAPVADFGINLTLDLPASAPDPSRYDLAVSCAGLGGRTITDHHALTVVGGQPAHPSTGITTGPFMVVGGALVVLGTGALGALRVGGGRRRR